MREALVQTNDAGGCDVTVFDQNSAQPVWSKTFDSPGIATAFLTKAGWKLKSLGAPSGPTLWQYDVTRRDINSLTPWMAMPAKPWGGSLIFTPRYRCVHSLTVDGESVSIYANAVVMLDVGYGFAYWYMLADSVARDYEELEREGSTMGSSFDPVLTLITPWPVVIEAIGTWSHERLALEHGVEYFEHLKKLYGELFDEALRANILRNNTRNIIGGDGGVDSGGDA